MKTPFLSFAVACCAGFMAHAQAPFNTMDSVDINNINAAVLVHGDMWWNPDSTYKPSCFYPNGTRKNINFAGAIWMSAFDSAHQLHVAAQTYRQDGNDYWPGPFDISDTLTYVTSAKWAKIWKVYRTDIQYFQSLALHTVANTPAAILTWPGKGSTTAQGNGGAPLEITTEMAPFVDLNGNGIYEPLLGEYPDVRGDEAIWWVFSDNGPTHNQSNGQPLGIEVHASSFAYKRGTLIDNVVYYDYTFINKSVHNFNGMRVALWDDIDLGYAYDDFIGFDSTWRMGINYNGTDCDGCGFGNPVNAYGLNPPQSAVTLISLPGDYDTNYVAAGSFTAYDNTASIIGNPNHDTVCNNYMHSKLSNGRMILDNYLADSLNCGGFNPASVLSYLYPGDPSDSTSWNECNCIHHNPGNRRFILSSNNFTLASGASAKMVFAQIVSDSAGACPETNFGKISIVADTAWKNYHHPPSPLPPNAIKNQSLTTTIRIYPNPARDLLYLETSSVPSLNLSPRIYNIIGQNMNVPIRYMGSKSEADISKLPVGVYYLKCSGQEGQNTLTFVKQ